MYGVQSTVFIYIHNIHSLGTTWKKETTHRTTTKHKKTEEPGRHTGNAKNRKAN
jgi:hypothetical protein